MRQTVPCPACGKHNVVYKNPLPTVDIIIVHPPEGIVLIERRNEPLGWALPGGFVEYGETVETSAVREALEETGLEVRLEELLGVYSAPERDPRGHTISTVFIATCREVGNLQGGDDAATARFFSPHELPSPVAFDHKRIIADFLLHRATRYGV